MSPESIILNILGLICAIIAVRAKNPISNIISFLGIALILSVKLVLLNMQYLALVYVICGAAISMALFLTVSSLASSDEYRFIINIPNMKAIGGIIMTSVLLGVLMVAFENSSERLVKKEGLLIQEGSILETFFVNNALSFQLMGFLGLITIFLLIITFRFKEDS